MERMCNVHVGVSSREYACVDMTEDERRQRKTERHTVQRETERWRAQNNSRQPGG